MKIENFGIISGGKTSTKSGQITYNPEFEETKQAKNSDLDFLLLLFFRQEKKV